MKRFAPIVFFVTFIWFLTGCDIINPSEQIPSYIKIDSIAFEGDSTQGSDWQNFSDAWVYVDEQLIGVYELPVTFPVLAEGNRRLRVRGGIRINGISSTRIAYPFMGSYTQNVEFKPKETVQVQPVERYNSGVTFAWISDFEDQLKFENLPDSRVTMKQIKDPAVLTSGRNGKACGGIILEGDSVWYSGTSLTNAPIPLPRLTNSVFLEMEYKNNQEFSVGLIARNPQADQAIKILSFFPSENWNKVYVNLTPTARANIEANGFYLYFYAQKKPEVTKGEIYIDNLKIVY
jgi:hypothetical protein